MAGRRLGFRGRILPLQPFQLDMGQWLRRFSGHVWLALLRRQHRFVCGMPPLSGSG